MSNLLRNLSALTSISADTADYNTIKSYRVSEATTNPSIILQTVSLPEYKHHLQQSVEYGLKTAEDLEEIIENAMDMITVSFGENILKVVDDKVHVQIDPRLAFITDKSVKRALKVVKMFVEKGIDKKRIVIKLPATWEGIQAANRLESNHGVNCNMTTMFNLVQAAACADAGVSYLAPFVGRIGLWYDEKKPETSTSSHPGVKFLKLVHNYIKKFGYKTKVMGAYFCNVNEVKSVAGCDIVTIPTKLIEELRLDNDKVLNNMDKNLPTEKIYLTEDRFRWLMNEDEMATDLLSETIRNFGDDYVKLENFVKNIVLSSKK